MKSLLFFFFALFSLGSATISVQWAGNVTLSGSSNPYEYDFRYVSVYSYSVPYFANGAGFTSYSVFGSSNQFNFDAVTGFGYQVTGYYPPTAWLGYVDAQVSWSGVGSNSSFWINFNASECAGFIAFAFLSLTEDGTTNTVNLTNLFWVTENLVDNNNNIYGIVLKGGESLLSSFRVEVAFFTSSVKGQISVDGGTPIVLVPKGLECIIKVSNFPFQSTSTNLRVDFAAASGTFSATASGDLIAGTGTDQTFVSLASSAVVDGSNKGITFSGWTDGDISYYPSDVQAKLIAKYGGQVNVKLGSVKITQGTVITFDPTIGSGSYPQNASTSSASLISAFLVLQFALIFFLFL